MSEQPIRRLTPVHYALALVVALTAVGVILRWWGPMNPAIRASVAVEDRSSSGAGNSSTDVGWGVDGTAQATMHLSNGSHSAVTVARLRAIRIPDSPDLPLPAVQVDDRWNRLEPNKSLDIDATLVAAGGCTDWVQRQPDDGRTIEAGSFLLVADLHTTSGRIMTVGRNIQLHNICPTTTFLPSSGVQPQDVAAAQHAVTVAFWTVYDSRNSLEERASLIDDVTGIPSIGVPPGIRSQVHDIVFTSPTAATVIYDIYSDGNPVATDQLGHARFVDRSWTVTRTTVCDDLESAAVHCS